MASNSHEEHYPKDFQRLQELADCYCVKNWTIKRCAEEFDLSVLEAKGIRKVHALRHDEPVDLSRMGEEAAVDHFAELDKRTRVARKARRKIERERDKAASKWWSLEESLQAASERFSKASYSVPRLDPSEEPEALQVLNWQDLHVAKAPARGEWSVESYCAAVLAAGKELIEKGHARGATRTAFVAGGDLVHVDNFQGATTQQTPQDMACHPTDALFAAIDLLIRAIDVARQIGPVDVYAVAGNHDRVLSMAAARAAAERFREAEDVTFDMGTSERKYFTWKDHLGCLTHGDWKKSQAKKAGSVIQAEARELLGETSFTSVFTGHFHTLSAAEDDTGIFRYAAPSPSLEDRYHSRSAYKGHRLLQSALLREGEPAAELIPASL